MKSSKISRIAKIKIKNKEAILLIINIIFVMRYFIATPIERIYYIIEAIFDLFMILYLIKEILKNRIINNNYFLYVLLLILFFSFYGPIRAKIVFGQPIYLGLLASRGALLLIPSIFVYNKIKNNFINLYQLKKIFVILCWVSLIVYTLIYFVLGPILLSGSKYMLYDLYWGYRYKFNLELIVLISFYYYLNYIKKGNFPFLLKFILILGFLIFLAKGRGFLISYIITFLLVSIFAHSNISKVIRLYFLVIVISLLFLISYVTSTEFKGNLKYYYIKYSAVIDILKGENTIDPSANARLIEATTMNEYLKEDKSKLLWGVGSLSNYFNRGETEGGFSSIFGYLHPSDVGILGIRFVWGIFGLMLIYLLPFFVMLKKSIKYINEADVFIGSISGFVIYSLIGSIYTGGIAFNPYFTYFCFGIILAFEAHK